MAEKIGPRIDVPQGSPFTIDNIPFGVIKSTKNTTPRCASAIGDHAIDLAEYATCGNLDALTSGGKVPFDVFSKVRYADQGYSIICRAHASFV